MIQYITWMLLRNGSRAVVGLRVRICCSCGGGCDRLCVGGGGEGRDSSVRKFKVIPGPCQNQHNTTHTVGIVLSEMFWKNM